MKLLTNLITAIIILVIGYYALWGLCALSSECYAVNSGTSQSDYTNNTNIQ